MTKTFDQLAEEARIRWNTLNEKPWIRVGGGLSGQAVGSDAILAAAQNAVTALESDATVSLVGTLGLMHREPVFDITAHSRRIYFERVSTSQTKTIITDFLSGEDVSEHECAFAFELIESQLTATEQGGAMANVQLPRFQELPENRLQHKIVTRRFGNIDPRDMYHAIASGTYSSLARVLSIGVSPEDVVDEVKASGLRGRGGAAFPAGVKWAFLAPSKAPLKFVLCNCEEGDPGAFNDKAVLENDPHTLLEGLILNGYATRSHKGYVFVRHGHDIPIDNMRFAIEEAYRLGLLGKNILGSNFSFDAEVALTGDSYVAGEETAMMEAIEGKRATPRFKPPFPAQSGLWGKPTNINNVKTLSYVSWILEHGTESFKAIGTEKSSGTAILCLSGHIKRPGLYEVPMGVTIRQVIMDLGGGAPNGRPVKLLQTGGPLGGVMGEEVFDTRIDFDAMSKAGAILGSGGIIVGDDTVDVLDLTRNLVAFNQFESCGKCFPCRLGNTHMLDVLSRMCSLTTREGDLELLQRVGNNMKAGSLCGHGQLGFNPISSALRYFEDEFRSALERETSDNGVAQHSIILPTRTRP